MMRILLLLLLLAGTAHGQVMTQKVPLGDPVEIRADELGDGAQCIWDAGTYDDRTRLYENNTVLAFWPKRAGNYRFVLVTGNAEGLKKKVYYVTVGDPGPDDPDVPDPDPPKPPRPMFPDEKLGLSSLVYEAGRNLSDAKTIGPSLGLNCRGYASRTTATQDSLKDVILPQMVKANNGTFSASPNAEAWKKVLGNDVAKVLFENFKDPNTADRKQFAAALLEIAVGFEAMK